MPNKITSKSSDLLTPIYSIEAGQVFTMEQGIPKTTRYFMKTTGTYFVNLSTGVFTDALQPDYRGAVAKVLPKGSQVKINIE